MPESTEAFPRSARLLAAGDYRRVFQQRWMATEHGWSARFRRNELGYARLGLAISKKNARRAVDRNRIKRLIRESFRQNRQLLDSLDIVILSTASSANLSNQELRDGLARLWKKFGVDLAISSNP